MFWALGAPWGVPRVCELGPEHQFLVRDTSNCPKQVAVAPFGAILAPYRSYRVWGAIGTTPGPQNGQHMCFLCHVAPQGPGPWALGPWPICPFKGLCVCPRPLCARAT